MSETEMRFDDDTMWLGLADGHSPRAALAWFPRRLSASPEARTQVHVPAYGLQREALDEDISIPALLSEKPRLAAG